MDIEASNTSRIRRVMQGNRSRDTKPELALRREAHRLGLRYRVDAQPLQSLRRRADLVFSGVHLAIFVDGCFWHACPEHYVESKTNQAYWTTKIVRNVERDRETDTALEAAGWEVLRFWEHSDPFANAEEIQRAVRRLGLSRTAELEHRS